LGSVLKRFGDVSVIACEFCATCAERVEESIGGICEPLFDVPVSKPTTLVNRSHFLALLIGRK
jgi:hypothetical protein